MFSSNSVSFLFQRPNEKVISITFEHLLGYELSSGEFKAGKQKLNTEKKFVETRETKKYSGTRVEECLGIGVETQPCLGGQGRQMITNIVNEADRENKLCLPKENGGGGMN